MNRGIYGKDSAASPTAQCDRNLSPLKSLPKTGVSAVPAADFREILAKVADFWFSGDKCDMQKPPDIAGFRA
jgi:hypothetical protein